MKGSLSSESLWREFELEGTSTNAQPELHLKWGGVSRP